MKYNPTDMAYSNLGTAYFFTGHYPEAAAAYLSALALANDNYLVWGNLAWVYWSMNGMDDQAKRPSHAPSSSANKAGKTIRGMPP